MTRREVFDSLHRAHTLAWERAPRDTVTRYDASMDTDREIGGPNYHRFHEWRMAWWDELCRAFPQYIDFATKRVKDHVVCV